MSRAVTSSSAPGSGYSGSPLARKLGIRRDALVALLNAPDHLPAILEPLEPGVTLRSDLRVRKPYDVVVLFTRSPRDLVTSFDRARARMAENGGLWLAWPKASSPLAGALRDGVVRARGLAAGMVDNKVCAIDEDGSAPRFVVRVADRRATFSR